MLFNVVFCFQNNFPTGTLLPCSLLILSMAKNQSDLENLVKNCLMCHFTKIQNSAIWVGLFQMFYTTGGQVNMRSIGIHPQLDSFETEFCYNSL